MFRRRANSEPLGYLYNVPAFLGFPPPPYPEDETVYFYDQLYTTHYGSRLF